MYKDTGNEVFFEEASSHFKCSNRRRKSFMNHYKVKSSRDGCSLNIDTGRGCEVSWFTIRESGGTGGVDL